MGVPSARSVLVLPVATMSGIPIVLETPKEGPDGKPTPANDRRNLALLRRLAAR